MRLLSCRRLRSHLNIRRRSGSGLLLVRHLGRRLNGLARTGRLHLEVNRRLQERSAVEE